jgi:hypothetical protein
MAAPLRRGENFRRFVEPLSLYRPRDPQASDLWRLLDRHFPAFQQVYDERFQAKYGFWRPVVGKSGVRPTLDVSRFCINT